VFFVAPHQLVKVLEAFAATLPDRPLAVARELTKLHEEVVRGTAPELLEHFGGAGVRGEVVLVVGGVGRKAGRGSSRPFPKDA
jgi:16S rRNA (cytidine1402-2'-O)-methyltransferase